MNLQCALVIRNKLERQIFLVCGEILRCFYHSWQINQISNMFDIFCHEWQKIRVCGEQKQNSTLNWKGYACVLLTNNKHAGSKLRYSKNFLSSLKFTEFFKILWIKFRIKILKFLNTLCLHSWTPFFSITSDGLPSNAFDIFFTKETVIFYHCLRDSLHMANLSCCLLIARMRAFSVQGEICFSSPHTRISCYSWQKISNMFDIWFICHEWQKHRKISPHTRKFCRSNLLRITSARCKFTSVRRALCYVWRFSW